MRKIGKAGKGNGMIVGFVAVIAVILVVGWFAVGQNITVNTDTTNPTQCGDSTGILTVSDRSLLVGGTAPSSPSIIAGIDGGVVTTSVTSGTTTFPVGAEVEVLISDTDSIDKSFKFTMPCGGYTLDGALYYSTSDNPAIEVQDKNFNTLSDNIAGETTNISDVGLGATMKAKVVLTGTSGEGTGDMVYVIEFPAGSSANITDVSLGGLSTVAVPTVHTSQNAGSKVVAFAIPNIEGATEKTYDLIVTLGTGKDLAGGVYTDLYAGQEFIDDDSTISSGVEDSDGTAKYENTIDSDFFIN